MLCGCEAATFALLAALKFQFSAGLDFYGFAFGLLWILANWPLFAISVAKAKANARVGAFLPE